MSHLSPWLGGPPGPVSPAARMALRIRVPMRASGGPVVFTDYMEGAILLAGYTLAS